MVMIIPTLYFKKYATRGFHTYRPVLSIDNCTYLLLATQVNRWYDKYFSNGHCSGSLLHFFSVFSNKQSKILQQICIRFWDSNSRRLEHKSPHITTRQTRSPVQGIKHLIQHFLTETIYIILALPHVGVNRFSYYVNCIET